MSYDDSMDRHAGWGYGREFMNSPTRLHPLSSASPQEPNFPAHAHPCPHVNQQRADGRPSNYHSAPNSATEASGPAAGRTAAFSPLPNPLSPRHHDVHTRAADTTRNPAALPPPPPRRAGMLARMRQSEDPDGPGWSSPEFAMLRGIHLDGIATPGSLYEHSLLYGTPYAGPTNPRPAANSPRAGGPPRERSSRSPNATATSPTPRRRHPLYRANHGSGFHNNEPVSIPSVAQLTAASVGTRRPRLHTRLRRSRGQSGDDNMDSDPGAPETPLDELPPFSDEGDIDREGRRIDQARHSLDEEGAVIPLSHTVRRHPMSKAAAYKLHIESLESVPIADLPVAERMCPICYNEYGVEGPEGINEAPLRIPRCKHIFGDHCIKKWLCQKHSCPYCRESAFGMHESELTPQAEEARREAIDARARQHWLQGVTALHRAVAVGDSRRANARPHPPPSDSEDQQRRTRQRLSREDSSLHSGSNDSGETALADGSQTESQSSHETQHQSIPRAPPIETLPPPTRLLTAREHGMSLASHLMRNMPRQPLPPAFVGPFPWGGHMQQGGFPPPFDPIHGTRNPEPVGAMGFQYGPDGPVPVFGQPLASFDPPAHFSAPPGYPPSNMQPDASVVPSAGLSPAAMAPFSPLPNRPQHAEAPAPYRVNVPAHPDPGNNGHSEQQSPGSASTRRRVW